MRRAKRSLSVFVVALRKLLTLARRARTRDDTIVYKVKPSDADPAIRGFDTPSYVFLGKGTSDMAQLVLFLPGTNGKPGDRPLMRLITRLGYRVIALQYNDDISVNPVCPEDPHPECSERFRADRIYGNARSVHVCTPPAETILNRLTKTLEYLAAHHPEDHWDGYLVDGRPNWSRFVVSGISQGAGMAALIAKREEVARVVLFSGPADYVILDKSRPSVTRPAAWLSQPSATPTDRWYAEYHARENGAARLQAAYAALGIPAAHVSIFDRSMPKSYKGNRDNPFHASTVKNTDYWPQWEHMFRIIPR